MTPTRNSFRSGVLLALLSSLPNGNLRGDGAVTMRETFSPGDKHSVQVRVQLTGELSVPAEDEQPARTIQLDGESRIRYVERILPPNPADGASRTLRVYDTVEFKRTVAGEQQSGTVRPGARRVVLLHKDGVEVPFSPDAPLTWDELDLVRTDVFVPALPGLLPNNPVAKGDTWTASPEAVRELTDFEAIEKGQLICEFDEETTLSGRRLARVTLSGVIDGVTEDGPNRHRLTGSLYFDLNTNSIAYLSLRGVRELLDDAGKPAGKITGQFTLSRQTGVTPRELADGAIERLTLEPDEENTRLLFEHSELGLRLTYPRHWQVGEVGGQQVALDGANGAGLLVTAEPPDRVPDAAAYQVEARAYLEERNARNLRVSGVSRTAEGVENFRIEGTLDGERLVMEYFILRQRAGSATAVARLPAGNRGSAEADISSIVRSIQLGR